MSLDNVTSICSKNNDTMIYRLLKVYKNIKTGGWRHINLKHFCHEILL